jgi:hypothetical protein
MLQVIVKAIKVGKMMMMMTTTTMMIFDPQPHRKAEKGRG